MTQFANTFSREKDFEDAMIERLQAHGWEETVLDSYTEEQLLQNWADILFENNRDINRLGDYPLTKTEMKQIIDQIQTLSQPYKINSFINGKNVTIVRDNPDDTLHFGSEVSLKIYDRQEIAAGSSRYQIARQPQFPTPHPLASDRRGDLSLLINGMPVIHIELKKTGIPVSQAINQIKKYTHEGVFGHGIFSLYQIFVAMNPEETVYFANPGSSDAFNPDYYFHWADPDNEPINEWYRICQVLLSIPMAHQLIGFYTVADSSKETLMALRSYQYYAANAISQKVQKTKWNEVDNHGGYIWHTTGSGKTLTSFKSAQLIAQSKDADKVIFLVDRIELGNQSYLEYAGFADDTDTTINDTEHTSSLVTKLKSPTSDDTLIITSIQKMSNIKYEDVQYRRDIDIIRPKRLVFIIDECHRSTFGEMLITIKQTFPKAIFFGFSGTPIQDENQRRNNTTSTVFGNELHRYTIADGIRDKNVLGFDPVKVTVYRDGELREAVILEKAKAKTIAEVRNDPAKERIYQKYMFETPMAGYNDDNGRYITGIEDLLPNSQFNNDSYRSAVVTHIYINWPRISYGGKFHSILATSSIAEAIQYYEIFRKYHPDLKVATLYDNSIDNSGDPAIDKEEATIEMLDHYNSVYGTHFSMQKYQSYKKDVALRLAHKGAYINIDRHPEKQLDLIIVVNQMLTGFDSKWINTLYLDKDFQYEYIVQAFSRTNRLFGPEKPFGNIFYYRFPHTMERQIAAAFKLYSGDIPYGLFVDKLESNLNGMKRKFQEICDLFSTSGVLNFEKLPERPEERKMFAKLFNEFNDFYEAARIQGFDWCQSIYSFTHEDEDEPTTVEMNITETTYKILVQRYKELGTGGGGPGSDLELPYDIDPYIMEINTDRIDAEYMQSRFEKYLRLVNIDPNSPETVKTLEDLHKSFATLSMTEQRFATQIILDIQNAQLIPTEDKDFRYYINEYMERDRNDKIHRFATALALDEELLRKLTEAHPTKQNINEYGRLDALINTVDKEQAKNAIEAWKGQAILPRHLNREIQKAIKTFVLTGLIKQSQTLTSGTTIVGNVHIDTVVGQPGSSFTDNSVTINTADTQPEQ